MAAGGLSVVQGGLVGIVGLIVCVLVAVNMAPGAPDRATRLKWEAVAVAQARAPAGADQTDDGGERRQAALRVSEHGTVQLTANSTRDGAAADDNAVVSANATRRRKSSRGGGFTPPSAPDLPYEVLEAQRAQAARAFTALPLYPRNVSDYVHPYGQCAGYGALAGFDFEPLYRKEVLRATGKEPKTYATTDDVVRLFREQLQRAESKPYNEPQRDGAADGNGALAQLVMPNHSATEMINETRVWERVIPDDRAVARTEHEQCHRAMARMLAIFASVMHRLNIRSWFVSHGTLLGAVRHGGFIPWAVDVDIVMPRSAMVLLRKLWRREFPRDMYLQTEVTEPSFHMWTGKERAMRVKDRYSTFMGHSFNMYRKGKKYRAKPWHLGVHLDIIPLERKQKGAQLKILHHYLERDVVFPLSAVCFENIIVPAPHNVSRFLESIYGPNYMEAPANAVFGGRNALPCLATTFSAGSRWSLAWKDDRPDWNLTMPMAERALRKPVLFPRQDPSGTVTSDARRPFG